MEKLLCFLVLTSLSHAFGQTDMSMKAFVFPKESDNSYVTLKARLTKPLKAFTVCLHFYTELSSTRGYSIFSYATKRQSNEILIFWSKDIGYSFTVGGSEILFKVPEVTVAPVHICTSWESTSGIVEFWVNGKPRVRKSLKRGYTVGEDASIILGQEQDSFGGSFETQQSLVGDIGNVNMWDFVLSPDEISTVYLGGPFSPNVLDWGALKYEVQGEVFIKPQLWS
ncbi:C-reactive protein isoform X1 [Theropithecus gelada]|uniref:C-reactive protein isoform X1 n=1 Tax=Theropithecus gelada TaxID=9565 RepID=UPI000DC19E02|nr:C-reactive protein isoform X1 [Theropithecus gelada]XP_025244399.1 C-reactive protein isoform X1 [Theropithecus gelada]